MSEAPHVYDSATGGNVRKPDEAFTIGVAQGVKAERKRIVDELAAIHHRNVDQRWCAECLHVPDSDGDCPTMRIAKGKP